MISWEVSWLCAVLHRNAPGACGKLIFQYNKSIQVVQPMLDGFDRSGIRYTLQTYDTTDPTSDDVERGYKTYNTKLYI